MNHVTNGHRSPASAFRVYCPGKPAAARPEAL